MLDPITPEQRAELRRLHEAATPGPWVMKCQGYRNGQTGRAGIHYWIVQSDGETTLPMDSAGDAKAEFNGIIIPVARNALPALLDAADERDALRERLAEVTRDRDALLSACEAVRADKFASLSASAWAGILSALAGR